MKMREKLKDIGILLMLGGYVGGLVVIFRRDYRQGGWLQIGFEICAIGVYNGVWLTVLWWVKRQRELDYLSLEALQCGMSPPRWWENLDRYRGRILERMQRRTNERPQL